ncbi:response regulator [Candidatus Saccharibacteria bacterium]|nr:response regulator [Candidatus Saccharibacteria bacterium]
MLVYIIDDDKIFAECLERFLRVAEKDMTQFIVKHFSNVIDAVAEMNGEVPDVVFLDILLDGPDGFTLLNEMASYDDTARVPIVIVSSLDIRRDLKDYGVVAVLDKATMTPEEVGAVLRDLHDGGSQDE